MVGSKDDFIVIRFRLSGRDPKQARLAGLVHDDIERGINISAVLRALLEEWYEHRERTGEVSIPRFMGAGAPGAVSSAELAQQEPDEDINDPDVQKLLGVSFGFGKRGIDG